MCYKAKWYSYCQAFYRQWGRQQKAILGCLGKVKKVDSINRQAFEIIKSSNFKQGQFNGTKYATHRLLANYISVDCLDLNK